MKSLRLCKTGSAVRFAHFTVSRGLCNIATNEAKVDQPTPPMEKKRHNLPSKLEIQHIFQAVEEMKKHAWAKFDETVEISVNLGVDPRKPNQSIKGVAKLPNGTGKRVRIGVFASGYSQCDTKLLLL